MNDYEVWDIILKEYGKEVDGKIEPWLGGDEFYITNKNGEKHIIGYIDQVYPKQLDAGELLASGNPIGEYK